MLAHGLAGREGQETQAIPRHSAPQPVYHHVFPSDPALCPHDLLCFSPA